MSLKVSNHHVIMINVSSFTLSWCWCEMMVRSCAGYFVAVTMTCTVLSVAMLEQYKYDNRILIKSDINTHMHKRQGSSIRKSHDVARRRKYDQPITRQNSNPLVYGLSYILRLLSLLVNIKHDRKTLIDRCYIWSGRCRIW